MKSLLIVILTSISACCFAQLSSDGRQSKDSLLFIKNLLENHLSGTTIRDLSAEFGIGLNSPASTYSLTGNVQHLIKPVEMADLQEELNRFLMLENQHWYVGTVYFDSYTDSVIVDLQCGRDRIFQSISTMPLPSGGIQAFSRRLHDYLMTQTKDPTTGRNGLRGVSTVNFILERDGSLIPLDTGAVGLMTMAFLQQERKWSLGIMSGRPTRNRISINIIPDYLGTSNSWPEQHEWAKIDELPSRAIGDVLTFCTTDKNTIPPNHTVISAIYDPLLRTYRMPLAHHGVLNQTDELIYDVLKAGRHISLTLSLGPCRRIYFYRPAP